MKSSLILVAAFTLSACATTKTLVPVDGSRADGIVRLSYQYGMFERPVVDYGEAVHTATARCAAWGYAKAEAFGSSESTCIAVNGYGNCIGWRVTVAYQCTTPTAPQDSGPTTSAAAATGHAPVTPVLGVDQLAMALPPGFVVQPVPERLKSVGAIFYAINRTLDIAVAVIPFRHEGVTDLRAFASTKRASQSDWLKDAVSSEVTGLEVGGRNAARFRATGTYNNVKITYVSTLIEGHDQIVFVTAWTGATNAQQQMTVLEGLADTVSGIS